MEDGEGEDGSVTVRLREDVGFPLARAELLEGVRERGQPPPDYGRFDFNIIYRYLSRRCHLFDCHGTD